MRKFLLNREFIFALVFWSFVISMPASDAFAFPSESLSAGYSASARDAQIDKIMNVLSRPEAQLHLRLMRINENQVKDALIKLDDSQLTQVAQKADIVKAGGDGALGLVIAVLVIVLLIVLIVNLSNKKIEVKDAK